MAEPSLAWDHEAAGFFVLRTPLLPVEEIEAWSVGLSAEDDREALRARLRAMVAREEVREALFVASPSLDERLQDWLSDPTSQRGLKVERPLTRYLERMSVRPTPFGLFAGYSVGRVTAGETRLVLEPRARYGRHTRLDVSSLGLVAETLRRDPALRPWLTFRPNSSLYPAAGRLRYAESRSQGGFRSYHLVGLEVDDYLRSTLRRAERGARLSELAEPLWQADPEITPEDAAAYVNELAESQVLVCDLAPTLTGPEPLDEMIARLRGLPAPEGASTVSALERVEAALAKLDARLGNEGARYREIAAELAGFGVTAGPAQLLHVDLTKPAPQATLGPRVVDEIGRAAMLMHRIVPSPEPPVLTRFRELLLDRYQGDEVPLVEALDPESGIGFGESAADASPLLEGVPFDVPSSGGSFRPRDAWLLRRVAGAVRDGARELPLDDEDLAALDVADRLPLPDAFSVIGVLLSRSPEALARGDFQFAVEAIAGPSGANALSRLCHADPALCEQVRALHRREEAHRLEAVFAEVVHMPERCPGNVVCRPALRRHEIPFLGRSGVDRDAQIPVTDLRVRVDTASGRIVLRSASLEREVIPRQTSAHAFEQSSLGMYRFLCALQGQGTSGQLMWLWGPLESMPFLPRLTHGRTVVARATWTLSAKELASLKGARGRGLHREVQSLRARLGLPRRLLQTDDDRALPVDLDNVLSVEAMWDAVKTRQSVKLTEMLPSFEQACVTGPEGRFMHEVVVPFVKKGGGAPPEPRRLVSHVRSAAFTPGSDWLFVKLYTGTATADRVLTGVVEPLVTQALGTGAADRWFFLRYADPDWHLRVRLHGPASRLLGEVLPALHAMTAPFLADGRIARLCLDTYERETHRYGGPEAVEVAERIFQVDSEAVLAIVSMLSGDAGAEARWRLALRGVDLMLDDLGFDLAGKRSVVTASRRSLGRRLSADPGLRDPLARKFRKERLSLEALLDPSRERESKLRPALQVLHLRSQRLVPLVGELRGLGEAGRLAQSLEELAASYLHMFVNRLLRASGPQHELILCELLGRLYKGRMARR